MARLDIPTRRRLNYGYVDLIPVTVHCPRPKGRTFVDVLANRLWHVPGRRVMSTHELIILAGKRGVSVSMTVGDVYQSTRTRLN